VSALQNGGAARARTRSEAFCTRAAQRLQRQADMQKEFHYV
jgi:hypothetical protein